MVYITLIHYLRLRISCLLNGFYHSFDRHRTALLMMLRMISNDMSLAWYLGKMWNCYLLLNNMFISKLDRFIFVYVLSFFLFPLSISFYAIINHLLSSVVQGHLSRYHPPWHGTELLPPSSQQSEVYQGWRQAQWSGWCRQGYYSSHLLWDAWKLVLWRFLQGNCNVKMYYKL